MSVAGPVRDGDACIPDWGRDALQSLALRLNGAEPFPCTFALDAFRRGHLRYAFLEDARSSDCLEQLSAALDEYLETYDEIAKLTSLLVFFKEPVLGRLDDNWRLFWDVLRHLSVHDESDWPETTPIRTDDPGWEFCYGGTPMFVVANTPSHSLRRSRWCERLCITFQPRSVFEGIEGATPRGTRARAVIRRRIEAYDVVPPSALLGTYGDPDNLEYRQYFLPDTDEPAPRLCPVVQWRDGHDGS